MQLSKFSDYSFRALIYLAQNRDRLCTVEELARELDTSEHHMKKVIHKLATHQYITSLKGRGGGLCLSREPKDINLADILKVTEENMNLFVCFQNNSCPLLSANCRLKSITHAALQEFLKKFSDHTLYDLI